MNRQICAGAISVLILVAGSIAQAAPPPPKELVVNLSKTVTMKLAHIPAGSFLMGSPDNEKQRTTDEGPQRKVTITRPFYMGIHEVTQEQ